MRYRQQDGYDLEAASDEATVSNRLPSLTVQSQADDADINVIMERYGITGKMPENLRIPMYGDFTEVADYQSALNAVIAAGEEFMRMPARVRARFDNDPQKLLDFMADGNNRDEATRLGLLKEVIEHVDGSSTERGSTRPASTDAALAAAAAAARDGGAAGGGGASSSGGAAGGASAGRAGG